MTPGTYALVVSSPGYEAAELAPATVTAGTLHRLEPARLRPGTGVISVEVVGVPFDRSALSVELIGKGRRPCEGCGDTEDPNAAVDAKSVEVRRWERGAPCSICGFSRDRSRLSLTSGRRAEFRGLASGNYALRVRDVSHLVVCEDRELALADAEIQRVTLELSRQRYVEVEFLDVDGASLANEWAGRLAEPDDEQVDVLVVSFEGIHVNPFTLAFVDEEGELTATTEFMPPIPSGGGTAIGVGVASFARRRTGTRRVSVDRARGSEDLLWPDPTPARFDLAEIACDIEADGIVRVGPLPSSRLTLRATAEHFAAESLVQESSLDTRVVLRLRSTSPESISKAELATYSRYELRE